MEKNFYDFELPVELTKALDELNITKPTDIQAEVIPLALQGKDIVAQAPTGTGKTLAFVLPIIKNIDRDSKDVQALILCPTRELVIQICEVIQSVLKYYERVRVAGLYGGQNIQRQLFCLRKKPQIVVGTPGRLLDHLDRRTLKLGKVSYFVLDEADEMLDMGFRGDIEKIDEKAGECQRLCFSATMPSAIRQLIEKLLNEPEYVKTEIDGEQTPKIEQYYSVLKDSQRVGAMIRLINQHKYQKAIAFCNTKMRADKLGEALQNKKVLATVIHGDLRQTERTQIIKRFRAGQLNVLVATDVAARGLDIDDIEAIFNFDPPTDSAFYVHRIGRTARAEKEGVAYTFVDSSQVGYIPSYQKVADNKLVYLDMGNISDSYTLPRDASNRMGDFHENESRFFLNVGKKDLLDKDSLTKLLLKSTPLKIYDIADVKIRDTYSFVSVIKGNESKLFKMAGVMLGNRKLNIQEAKEEEPKPSDDKAKFKSKSSKEKTKSKGASVPKSNSKSAKNNFAKNKTDKENKNSKDSKAKKKSVKKPLSNKMKFFSDDNIF